MIKCVDGDVEQYRLIKNDNEIFFFVKYFVKFLGILYFFFLIDINFIITKNFFKNRACVYRLLYKENNCLFLVTC